MKDNCWISPEGECLYEPPEGLFGFVYLITVKKSNNVPKELWGKIYVGKKQFNYNVKKKIAKKVIKQTKTRKRVERVKKDSGWLSYWGSSRELLQDIATFGEDNFQRKILTYCNNKAELSYWEMYYQIIYDVLFSDSYNGWIKATIYKKTLNK